MHSGKANKAASHQTVQLAGTNTEARHTLCGVTQRRRASPSGGNLCKPILNAVLDRAEAICGKSLKVARQAGGWWMVAPSSLHWRTACELYRP